MVVQRPMRDVLGARFGGVCPVFSHMCGCETGYWFSSLDSRVWCSRSVAASSSSLLRWYHRFSPVSWTYSLVPCTKLTKPSSSWQRFEHSKLHNGELNSKIAHPGNVHNLPIRRSRPVSVAGTRNLEGKLPFQLLEHRRGNFVITTESK